MGDLSTNFSRWEFSCKCGCGYNTVDAELLTVLQWLRYETKTPITINSGCRCVEHNEVVQKESNKHYIPYSSKSQHMLGRAADIVVVGVDPEEVYNLINKYFPSRLGLIQYDYFIHVDSRSRVYREKK